MLIIYRLRMNFSGKLVLINLTCSNHLIKNTVEPTLSDFLCRLLPSSKIKDSYHKMYDLHLLTTCCFDRRADRC